MKIAVVGAGAIGSIIAGYLRKAGEDVLLVGRPDHVQAVNQKGLRVTGVRGEEVIFVPAQTRLRENYDLVIFCVKTQDLEAAYEDNHEYMEDSWVVTTQNGVQADNMISSHCDKQKVISSIVMFGATYMEPGEVLFNFEGSWIIGKPFVLNDSFVEGLAAVFRRAFSVIVSDDIMGMKWLKLFVNFNNCLPGLTGLSMQETFSDLELCRLSMMLLKEGYRIAEVAGIRLVSLPQFPAERIKGLVQMPDEQGAAIIQKSLLSLSQAPLYGSILQSIKRKKTSEIDFINGEIVMLAKHIQRDAPLNTKVVDLVHEVENTGRFFKKEEIKKTFGLI